MKEKKTIESCCNEPLNLTWMKINIKKSGNRWIKNLSENMTACQ